MRRSLERLSERRCASFLAVLKRFGAGNAGLALVPQPGWTLALDIPAAVPGLAALLDRSTSWSSRPAAASTSPRTPRLRPELLPGCTRELAEWREVRGAVDPDRRAAHPTSPAGSRLDVTATGGTA